MTHGSYPLRVHVIGRRSLLVLPAALIAGHLLAAGSGLASGSRAWDPQSIRTLLCVAAPFAALGLLQAAHDGYLGRTDRLRPGSVVAQQVLAFIVFDALEHLAAGTSPIEVVTDRSYWASLGIHAAIGLLAWLALRVSGRAGRALALIAAAHLPRCSTDLAQPAPRSSDPVAVLALSSLSRRGPPGAICR